MAAQALDVPTRRQDAQAALVACITDEDQLNQLGDDTLCHGWAGLVHTARRMLTDAEPNRDDADALARLEHRWRRRTQAVRERPKVSGMLEGGAGIALTDLPACTGWDLCLLTTPSARLPRPARPNRRHHPRKGTG